MPTTMNQAMFDPEMDSITQARLYAKSLRDSTQKNIDEGKNGRMVGPYWIANDDRNDLLKQGMAGGLEYVGGQAATNLGAQRDAEFASTMAQMPTANQQLPMQGPTEDGGALSGSFSQAKSPDQYNTEMQGFGTKLMQSRDPRAQAIAGQVLTRSLEYPMKEMERQRNEQEAQAFLKTLGGRTEPATALTGTEAGVARTINTGEEPQKGFVGDIAANRRRIMALPDSPDKEAALTQLEQQVAAAAPKPISVLPSTIAAARTSTAKFAPSLQAQEARADKKDVIVNINQPEAARMQDVRLAAQSEENNKKIAAQIESAKLKVGEPPNPETVKLIAQRFIEGDKGAMVGLGRNPKLLEATLNAVAVQAAEQGVDAKELVQRSLELAGATAEQRTMGNQIANVNMAAKEARNMIPIMVEASKKVDRSQFPDLNAVTNAVNKGIGDENIVALDQSIESLINAYARAVNPRGVGTTEQRNAARERLKSAYTQGQIESTARVMDQEIAAALSAPREAREQARIDRVGAPGTKATVLPTTQAARIAAIPGASPTVAPGGMTEVRRVSLKNGNIGIEWSDGSRTEVPK